MLDLQLAINNGASSLQELLAQLTMTLMMNIRYMYSLVSESIRKFYDDYDFLLPDDTCISYTIYIIRVLSGASLNQKVLG